MMEAEGSVSCILCSVNLPQRALALPLDPASILSFTKLLRGTETNDDLPLFTHSPYLLFCFNCHAKVHDIHEIFNKLENLRAQLSVLRIDVEGELLRVDGVGGTWARNRSAALRHRIIRELSLDSGGEEFAEAPQNNMTALEFKVEINDFPDQNQYHSPELNNLIDDGDYEPDPCEDHVPEPQEFDDFDPLYVLPGSAPHHPQQEPFDLNLNWTDASTGQSIVLKPCRVELGSRIDASNTQPQQQMYKICPKRCPYPGCTSKLQFSSKTQFNRHMKRHNVKVKTRWSGFSLDPSPMQSSSYELIKQRVGSVRYPTKCPRSDCVSKKIFEKKSQLQRHLREVHFKELKPITVEPGLDERLNSFVYPTQCFKPNCSRNIPFASKDELRRHLRETHFIRSRPPLHVDPIANETKGIQYPTACIREFCRSTKMFTSQVQLRRHLREVHDKLHSETLPLNFEQEVNMSDLETVTIEVSNSGGIENSACMRPSKKRVRSKPKSTGRRKRRDRSKKMRTAKTPTTKLLRTEATQVSNLILQISATSSEEIPSSNNTEATNETVTLPVESYENIPRTRLRAKKRPATYAESEDDEVPKSNEDEANGFRCTKPKCRSRSFVFNSELKYRVHMRHSHGEMRRPESWKQFHQRCPKPGCTSKVVFTKGFMYRRHMKTHAHAEIKLQSNPILAEITAQDYPTKCTRAECKSQKLFQDKAALRRHLVEVHDHKTDSYKFVVQNDLGAELDALTYPTKCYQPECPSKLVFTCKRLLQSHLKIQHHIRARNPRWLDEISNELKGVEFPTRCIRAGCPKETIYYRYGVLRKHLKEFHDRPKVSKPAEPITNEAYVCHICGRSFHSALSLRHHGRSHDKTKTMTCEHCGAGFKSKNGLKIHVDSHHAAVAPVFLCSQCPKTFKVRRLLEVHAMRHSGVKNFYCRVCPKGYIFRIDAEEHEKFAHWEELGLDQIKCPVCQKVYSKMGIMRIHLKTHTGEQRYICTECEYKTDYKNDFKEHVATVHQADFPHECSMCGKKFKLERRLRQHELEHKDDYSNACELCDKRFASPRTLRIHNERKHGALPSNRDNRQGMIAEFTV